MAAEVSCGAGAVPNVARQLTKLGCLGLELALAHPLTGSLVEQIGRDVGAIFAEQDQSFGMSLKVSLSTRSIAQAQFGDDLA
ncbi:hypothetical protein, partial [Erwinia amylovora]|uniref:hypothetical protein n=1 Tax=Erwinia amylovora TaxID=552 RepID=UPI001CBA82FF